MNQHNIMSTNLDMEKVEQLILADKKDEFIALCSTSLVNMWCQYSSSFLMKLICKYRAVGCATALLGGETLQGVNVNDPLEDGLSPLQNSAQSLSFGLTQIFLKHRANPNICGSMDISMLPLSMALKALCDHYPSDWTCEKSVFKLLYIFCLPDLKEPLDTIKLLVEQTQTEEVEKLSLQCVEEGEVIQLAALLMTAWDRLIPSSVEDVESCLIGQHIWGQVQMICNKEFQLVINCGPCCEKLENLKTKKINLLLEWKLLKVLETARDVIHEFRCSSRVQEIPKHEVAFDVACHLVTKNIQLYSDDVYTNDIKCLRPKLEDKAAMTEAIEKELYSGSISMMLRKEHEAGCKEYYEQKNQLLETVLPRTPVHKLPGGGCCSVIFPMARLYHTNGALICNLKSAEIVLPRKTQKVAITSSSMFLPSARICARLLLCVKRV